MQLSLGNVPKQLATFQKMFFHLGNASLQINMFALNLGDFMLPEGAPVAKTCAMEVLFLSTTAVTVSPCDIK